MNYEDFLKELLDCLHDMNPDAVIDLQRVVSANDTKRDALLIRMNADAHISPAIYIEEYYRYFTDPDREPVTIAQVAHAIMQQYFTCSVNTDFADQIANLFQDIANVKNHIIFRLVGIENNQNILKTVPHRRIYDMALIYYLTFYVDSKGQLLMGTPDAEAISSDQYMNASAMITMQHLNIWNMTENDLYMQAMVNTPKLLPFEMRDIRSMLREFSVSAGIDNLDEEQFSQSMWILTNTRRLYGASCCMYPGLLERLADRMQTDFYCLPSSVHEMILLPTDLNDPDRMQVRETLYSMVCEVNATAVKDEDKLTDNVYYYNYKTRSFCAL